MKEAEMNSDQTATSESYARCAWAIKFGTILTTRCHLTTGHDGNHEAKGLAEFPYQRITWLVGDRREFQTDRADIHAWEG